MQYVVISIMVCEILWRSFSHATGGSEDPRSRWGWGWGWGGLGCWWGWGVGVGLSDRQLSVPPVSQELSRWRPISLSRRVTCKCLQSSRGCHGGGLYHCHGSLLLSASRVAGAVTVEAYMCFHVLVVTDILDYLCILKMNNNSTGCQ